MPSVHASLNSSMVKVMASHSLEGKMEEKSDRLAFCTLGMFIVGMYHALQLLLVFFSIPSYENR